MVKKQQYLSCLYQFTWFIAALYAVEVVDVLVPSIGLDHYGVRPGDWSHWEGIFMAPLLHSGWAYVIGNSIALLIFGSLILIKGWQLLVEVTLYSIIVGGVVVMVMGSPNSVHIGASGVVYGYWLYIIAAGFYERSGNSILMAIGVIAVYGGYVYGMIPSEYNSVNSISWQGHLGGAIGGFLVAKGKRRSINNV